MLTELAQVFAADFNCFSGVLAVLIVVEVVGFRDLFASKTSRLVFSSISLTNSFWQTSVLFSVRVAANRNTFGIEMTPPASLVLEASVSPFLILLELLGPSITRRASAGF